MARRLGPGYGTTIERETVSGMTDKSDKSSEVQEINNMLLLLFAGLVALRYQGLMMMMEDNLSPAARKDQN